VAHLKISVVVAVDGGLAARAAMAINQNAGRHLQSSMLACVWAEFYRGASRWHGRLRSEKSTRHSWRAPENAIRNHFFLAARVPPTSPHGFPRPRLAQNAHAELVAHRHCCGCVALQFCTKEGPTSASSTWSIVYCPVILEIFSNLPTHLNKIDYCYC